MVPPGAAAARGADAATPAAAAAAPGAGAAAAEGPGEARRAAPGLGVLALLAAAGDDDAAAAAPPAAVFWLGGGWTAVERRVSLSRAADRRPEAGATARACDVRAHARRGGRGERRGEERDRERRGLVCSPLPRLPRRRCAGRACARGGATRHRGRDGPRAPACAASATPSTLTPATLSAIGREGGREESRDDELTPFWGRGGRRGRGAAARELVLEFRKHERRGVCGFVGARRGRAARGLVGEHRSTWWKPRSRFG